MAFSIAKEGTFDNDFFGIVTDKSAEVTIKVEITTRDTKTEKFLTFAKHAPFCVLADELFRSLSRGARRYEKLQVRYKYQDAEIEFKGPEPLGADDLRVLQGLVALAGARGGKLAPTPVSDEGLMLRNELDIRGDARARSAIAVQCSYSELAREIGYSYTRNTEMIQKCIERLFTVSIFVRKNGRSEGYRLLSRCSSDNKSGALAVALNPAIADAILGSNPQHIRIEMAEVRALKSDPARLIHQRLCGFINAGSRKPVGIERLISYVWPTDADPNATKKRRSRVKEALKELENLGWKVIEVRRGLFEINRPPPANT